MTTTITTIRRTLAGALLAACCAGAFAAGQADSPAPDAGQAGQSAQPSPREHGPRHGRDGGPGDERPGMPPGGERGEHGGHPGFGGPGFGHPGFGHRGFGGPGFGGGPMAHLAGLRLTEAQQDKVFAIMHAAAPQLREQQKALRRAHEALRALNEADRFDEAKAGAVSRELGQAVAAEALSRARLHAQVLAVLTPEQRERLHKRHQMGSRERG